MSAMSAMSSASTMMVASTCAQIDVDGNEERPYPWFLPRLLVNMAGERTKNGQRHAENAGEHVGTHQQIIHRWWAFHVYHLVMTNIAKENHHF